MENQTSSSQPEATTTASTATTTTAPAAKAGGNKKMLIIVAAVVGLILVLGLVALIFSGALKGLIGKTAFSNFDVSNPQAATDQINSLVIMAVESIDTSKEENLDFTKFYSSLGVDTSAVTSTEFNISFDVEAEQANVSGELNGKTKNISATEGNLELDGDVTVEADGLSAEIPVGLKYVDKTLYFNVDIPDAVVESSPQFGVYAELLNGKWVSVPSQQTETLTQSYKQTLTEEDKQKLLTALREEPLFINPKSVADRKVGDATIKCMSVELNPETLKEDDKLTALENFPALELCKSAGQDPIYVGLIIDQDGVSGTVGMSFLSLNETVEIEAPADAVDFIELLTNSYESQYSDLEEDFDASFYDDLLN